MWNNGSYSSAGYLPKCNLVTDIPTASEAVEQLKSKLFLYVSFFFFYKITCCGEIPCTIDDSSIAVVCAVSPPVGETDSGQRATLCCCAWYCNDADMFEWVHWWLFVHCSPGVSGFPVTSQQGGSHDMCRGPLGSAGHACWLCVCTPLQK